MYASSSVKIFRLQARDRSSGAIRPRTEEGESIMHKHLRPACSPGER